jgi:hypothetical protein
LPLDYGVSAQYYWFYGFALAKNNRCGDAIPVFQALLTGVPDYQLAVDNANAGLDLCMESVGTPEAGGTSETTETPEVGTTPESAQPTETPEAPKAPEVPEAPVATDETVPMP